MKWRCVRTPLLVAVTLLLSVLAGIAVPALTMPAYAQGPQPQPYLYAMPKCSGLSLAQLQWAQQDYDTAYGFELWGSFDGLSFWRNGAVYNKALTAHHFTVLLDQAGATIPVRAGIDWVRRDWITL